MQPQLHTITFLALSLTATLCGQDSNNKAALKTITSAYERIEAEHSDWRHVSYRLENLDGGGSLENHVWLSPDEPQWVKVESNDYDDHGEIHRQYYFKGDDLVFTLDRYETTPAIEGAATQIVEQRYYFAEGRVIRQLRKEASIPPGKPADLSKVPNVEIDLSKKADPADFSPEEVLSEQVSIATPIIDRARRLDDSGDGDAPAPQSADSGSAPITGAGWRMIAGSSSPDGAYALGWGIKGQDEVSGELDADGTLMGDREAEGLTNYVINLRDHSIVGEISGKHCGDNTSVGHFTVEVEWSKNDFPPLVAQATNSKWATDDAMVYAVFNDGGGTSTLSPGFNILEQAVKALEKKVANHPAVKKHGFDSFALTLRDLAFARRNGVTQLSADIGGIIPKSEEEDAYFDANVTFEFVPGNDIGDAPSMKLKSLELYPAP